MASASRLTLPRCAGLMACLCSVAAVDTQLCTGSCKANEEADLAALMQLGTNIHRAGRSVEPGPQSVPTYPAARSLLSTDPKASAEFFTKYFLATDVALPMSADPRLEVTAVDIDIGAGTPVRYVFINDQSKLVGNVTPEELQHYVGQNIVQDIVTSGEIHSEWLDNHDAFPMSALIADNLPEHGVVISTGEMLKRLYIPNTLWSIELAADGEWRGRDYTCLWKKSTFMASDPVAAGDFAVNILGAERLESPDPPDPVVAASFLDKVWVEFPASGYQWHFVGTIGGSTQAPELYSAAWYAHYLEQLRDLPAGQLDRFMDNSLVWKLPSLDPVMSRLKEHGLQYLLTSVSETEYALLTDIPGNGITLQFRSLHVSLDSPTIALPNAFSLP